MALINLRNALMARKRLPYDAEVEFLESTGTQYINTGVIPVDDATFVVCAAFTDLNTGRFGAVQLVGTGGTTYRYYFGVLNGKWIGAINSTNYNHNISQADTDIHIFKTNSLGLYIDDVMVVAAENSKPTIPVYLANIDGASTAIPTKAKLYSCKIYDANGVLIRDLIPVRKKTVGYLYDRVSKRLFGNAGTGDFVLGPDVVPVEYIESHGTEYIDTDKSMDLPIHLEADINFTNPSTGSKVQTFVGGYNANLTNHRFWVTSLPQGKINCGLLTNSISTNLVPANRKVHLVVDFENGRQTATIDGVQYTSASQSTTNYWFRNWKLRIFQSFGTIIASNNIPVQAITNRIDIDIGASQALRLLPVRVGSGSTWEGALIDTLTRRIYRNAGTGAFAYGNDLKYPIPAS